MTLRPGTMLLLLIAAALAWTALPGLWHVTAETAGVTLLRALPHLAGVWACLALAERHEERRAAQR